MGKNDDARAARLGVFRRAGFLAFPELDVELAPADIGATVGIGRIGGKTDLADRKTERHQPLSHKLEPIERQPQRVLAFRRIDMGDNIEPIGSAFAGRFANLAEHCLGLRRDCRLAGREIDRDRPTGTRAGRGRR
jgi:hypothetical protein